ncbi:MAG: hypothetical protein D8M52_00205 [Chlorobi bacterium]|nr:MAG: OmpA family protein [Bacteroidota bacterium]KXK34298.1 MAG: putative outer membrane lipoprotein [Chlorobi bacterium OLB6]MBL1160125.1 hypothetical protein [Chlorobiota bacterium]MCC6330622.1 OmpA family protein [Ignavibacteria bacterium]MBV6463426.1 hypothetical protein [Chlorobiota bacterium]
MYSLYYTKEHIQRLVCLCTLLFVVVCGMFAAPQELFRIGLTGSAGLNMHNGTLTTNDGLLECGKFTDATTPGWTVGNSFWYPLTENIVFNPRLQYWKADGVFTAPNDVQPNVALPNGTLVRMNSEYRVSTSLDYINLDLLALWYPIERLFLGFGPQVGCNLRAAFEQTETILEPSFLEFTQGGRERTFLSSSFAQNNTSANLRIAVSALAGYDIPTTADLVISPEIGYTYGFTNILNTSDWSVHYLHAGVTVAWSVKSAPEPLPAQPTPPADAKPVIVAEAARPVRSMSVDVSGKMSDGSIIPGADILIHEERIGDVAPLLPFVFFDAGSASVPARYKEFAGMSFDERMLQDSILGLYHNLLNIVGSRLRLYPDANLVIQGFCEPLDGETDTTLALQRARSVKDFLANSWRISESRIQIKSGTLPAVVSNRAAQDGREENRRAELSSADPRILAPIQLAFTKRNVEPRELVIKPVFSTQDDIAEKEARLIMNGNQVGSSIPISGAEAVWTVNAGSLTEVLGVKNSVTGEVNVSVRYSDGQTDARSSLMSVRRIVQSRRYSNELVRDSVIERFRLIFFDFDKPVISSFNKSILDLIRSRMRTNSAIRITGFTDRMGSVPYNTELSRRRAEAIEADIKQRIVPNHVSLQAAGPTLIYNNELPEGRWYNRTVLIEIATPAEE